MRISWRALVFVLGCFLVSASSVCYAKDPLRVSLPSFPPFYDENNFNRGAVVKLYQMIGKQLGRELEIVPLPYARILYYLKTGEIDMAIIFRNESIKDHVTYLAKASESEVLVWPRRGIVLEEHSSLKNLRIATIRKASFSEDYDNDESIDKVYVDDYVQGLAIAFRGRVDGIVGSRSGIEYSAKIGNIGMDAFGDPLLINSKEWWVHYSNKSKYPSDMKKVKDIVEGLYEKNLIYHLYLKELEMYE